jgi:predicted nucleic acid-binding protein
MNWVIDASVAVKWFLKDEAHPHAEAILERLIGEPEFFAIPELFCFEVFSVLSRVHPYGRKVFVEGVLPLVEGGLLRQPMTVLLAANAEQFVKMGLTGYDACYAALAKEIKGVWLTFDEKAHRLIAKQNISCYLEKGLPKNWK